MIVKADKGKTCVVPYSRDCTNKVENLLINNNFQKLPKDPTDKYQKNITKVLQQCKLIANKGQECFPRNNKDNWAKVHQVGCFIN
jgi:hypothetical protein